MSEEEVKQEKIRIDGDSLVATVKDLIHEGNIRRIIVQNDEGKTLIEVPMTLGVIVALAAPVIAALSVIGALLEKIVIVVEKVEEKGP